MTQAALTIAGIRIGFMVICWVSSLVLYFHLVSNNRPILRLLPLLNKDWKGKPLAIVLDALIVTVVGAVIGTIITNPVNAQQAIATGLGWTGLLSIVRK
jgi:uncharacterized membrane protein YbjE (DUF340 family)